MRPGTIEFLLQRARIHAVTKARALHNCPIECGFATQKIEMLRNPSFPTTVVAAVSPDSVT